MKKFLFLFLFLLTNVLVAQKIIIHAGTLIDGVSDKAQFKMSIIVEGDKITDVQKGYLSGTADDRSIDMTAMTVMPGWIDMHVHIEGESSPDRYLRMFTENSTDVAYKAAEIAKRTLMAGFTTVRDLGGSGVNVSLRNAINKGLTVGPRILTAEKSLSVTGGHADPTNSYRNDLKGDPGPKEGVVNGIADARKAVRQRYKNGADLIKITATGGVLSVATDGTGPHFQEDEIRAIVETATDLGYHVAAHAHGDEGMQRAVRAGVRTIEHGTYMSEKTMELMIAMNTYLVSTITAGKEVEANAKKPGYFPEVVAEKARVVGPQIVDTFIKAYKKGVPIAFGTDAGVFRHGDNYREFIYMVESGMPAMKVIQSATSVNALVLNLDDQIGQVKKGFVADLVAVKGNPLNNIRVMKDVALVMKGGEVMRLDE